MSSPPLYSSPSPSMPVHLLLHIEHILQLHNQLPLILTDIAPEVLLERIDTLSANSRVKDIVFFQVATVHGLVGALDLDGDGGLASLADLHGFVVALDGSTIKWVSKLMLGERTGGTYTLPR